MTIIHGATVSPFTRKVCVAAEEKGIEYELKALAPLPRTPELLAMNPLGKIPILEYDGRFIPDSSVICALFEALRPEPALFPADPLQRARALWIEEYADTALAEAIGPVFFERFVKPNLLGAEPDEARAEASLSEAVPAALDWLEAQLEGPTWVASGFGIADLAVVTQLLQLGYVGVDLDAARRPKLTKHYQSTLERPGFQACLERERT